jgi:hemolysin activation/secretion protein
MECSRFRAGRLALRLAWLCGVALLVAMPAHAQTMTRLIFLPAAQPETVSLSNAQSVDVSRVPLLNQPGFTATMAGFIGRDLSDATLSAIPPLAVAALKRAGWPSSRVTILQPDTGTGIVRAIVTLYTIRTVTVEDNRYFGPAYYRSALGISPGASLDMNQLRTGLQHINAGARHNADIDLQPGDEPGDVDVVIHDKDRLPLALSAGYSNSGPTSTGRDQFSFGATWYNTIGGLDDQLSYEFLTSNVHGVAPWVQAHSLDYELTLPRLGTVSLVAAYAYAKAAEDGVASGNGQTVQVSPRFTRQIATAPLQLSIQAGYDFKTIDNSLLFGGTSAGNTDSHISQFVFALLANRADDWGSTGATWAVFASPGGMMGGNDDASFRSLSIAARARYVYTRLDLTRATTLPLNLVWVIRGSAQEASAGLLPTEQLSAGGPASVRGYPTYTARGDAGVLLSNELRFPAISVGKLSGFGWNDQIEPFLFIDYGSVHARDQTTVVDGTLTSFGPGIRFDIDHHIDLEADLGGQIRTNGSRHYPGQFFDVAATMRY